MFSKTNDPDFVRDDRSGALINTNVSAYKMYKQQRASQQQMETVNRELDSLKSELEEMKQLLKDILREKHGNSNF